MATILTDNFNSYTDGDLNGQGNWAGSVDFDIQGTVVKEGTKAVKVITSNAAGVDMVKIGSLIADGRITVYLRNDTSGGANARTYFIITENGSTGNYQFKMNATTGYYYSGGWQTLATGLAYDTWHCFEMEWRSSDKYARYRVNAGAWSSWCAGVVAFTSGLNKVTLNQSPDSGTTICYFDYIAENPYAAGTNFQLNIGDTYKAVSAIQVNVGDSWKAITKGQVNLGDTWKSIF